VCFLPLVSIYSTLASQPRRTLPSPHTPRCPAVTPQRALRRTVGPAAALGRRVLACLHAVTEVRLVDTVLLRGVHEKYTPPPPPPSPPCSFVLIRARLPDADLSPFIHNLAAGNSLVRAHPFRPRRHCHCHRHCLRWWRWWCRGRGGGGGGALAGVRCPGGRGETRHPARDTRQVQQTADNVDPPLVPVAQAPVQASMWAPTVDVH